MTQAASPLRQQQSAEVIVVGGGLSGLQAAYDIQRVGLTCLVLEAGEQIGGAFSCIRRPRFDVTKHPQTSQLIKLLGLDAGRGDTQTRGDDVVEGVGAFDQHQTSNLCEDDRRSYVRVRDNLDDLCNRVNVNRPAQMLPNYGSMNVHELVASHGATDVVQSMANAWTNILFGLSSRRVSALFFLVHCKSAGGLVQVLSRFGSGNREKLYLTPGIQDLRQEMSARLHRGTVRVSEAVRSVDQTSGNKCVLTTASGNVFHCTRVILAIRPALFRNIDFLPTLSEDKQRLLNCNDGAFCTNVTLSFDRPWWTERGFSGFAQGLDGPAPLTVNTSMEGEGKYSLTCLISGEAGQQLWMEGEEERKDGLMQHLEAIFGAGIPAPLDVIEDDMGSGLAGDPAHLAIPATHLRHLENDQWAAEGALHFAGSETAYAWRGHVEGALTSGSRGAREVMEILAPAESTELARL